MRKSFLLAALFVALFGASAFAADTTFVHGKGGGEWEDGEWTLCPIWSDSICAIVIEDDWGNVTTGIFGWPGGERVGRRFIYCPNPGPEICAIVLEGPNPGDPSTHAFYGKGGAKRNKITGDWVYCPIPAQQICAIVEIGDDPDGPIITHVYGSGGYYEDEEWEEYCPHDGDEICYTIIEVPEYDTIPPPGDTIKLPGDDGQRLGKVRPLDVKVGAPSATTPDHRALRQTKIRLEDAVKEAPQKTDLD